MVKLSYGHGFMDDCGSTTGWTKTDNGNTSTFTIDRQDNFKLNVTAVGGAEETRVSNNTPIGITTNVYPQLRYRYVTNNNNIKAKIRVSYSDSSYETVLADSSSTSFTVGTKTLTSGKTLNYVHLYADHAVGAVYYDFILVHVGDFTLPNVAGGMTLDPVPREAILDVFGRDTDITQLGGTKNAVVTLTCDLDQGNWKRSGDSVDGEVFLDMFHNRSSEPWQWLQTGSHNFKVTVRPKFRWVNNGDGSTSRLLDLTLTEYSLGEKSGETYAERWGI